MPPRPQAANPFLNTLPPVERRRLNTFCYSEKDGTYQLADIIECIGSAILPRLDVTSISDRARLSNCPGSAVDSADRRCGSATLAIRARLAEDMHAMVATAFSVFRTSL
jgi:hypothetical protein